LGVGVGVGVGLRLGVVFGVCLGVDVGLGVGLGLGLGLGVGLGLRPSKDEGVLGGRGAVVGNDPLGSFSAFGEPGQQSIVATGVSEVRRFVSEVCVWEAFRFRSALVCCFCGW
jgi:hypothetical protein